jgi:hypothetical protein
MAEPWQLFRAVRGAWIPAGSTTTDEPAVDLARISRVAGTLAVRASRANGDEVQVRRLYKADLRALEA